MVIDQAWLSAQQERYQGALPIFVHYKKLIDWILLTAGKSHPVTGHKVVLHPESWYIDQLVRFEMEQDERTDPIDWICEGHIIVPTHHHLNQWDRRIRSLFYIMDCPVHNSNRPLGISHLESKKMSYHYIVQVNREQIEAFQSQSADSDGPFENLAEILDQIGERKAVIQLRSQLAQVWHQMLHRNLDPGLKKIPEKLAKAMTRLSEMLTYVDDQFANAMEPYDKYSFLQTDFLDKYDAGTTLKTHLALRQHGNESSVSLHRLAQLALNLSDYDTARSLLNEWKESDETMLVHDYGMVLKMSGKLSEAEPYFIRVTRMDPDHVAARCDLGDIYIEREGSANLKKGLRQFERAYELDSTEPRIIRSLLESKILANRNVSFLPLLKPAIESAITICRNRILNGIYLPHAFFDLSLLYGFSNQAIDSFEWLLEGLLIGPGERMIQKHLNTLSKLLMSADILGPQMKQAFLWQKIMLTLLHLRQQSEEPGKTDMHQQDGYRFISMIGSGNVELTGHILALGGGMEAYKGNIKGIDSPVVTAIRSFDGPIISGGHQAGPAVLSLLESPELAESNDWWLYGMFPAATVHDRLSNVKRVSTETGHGAASTGQSGIPYCLQYWVDMVLNDAQLKTVRYLGINNGQLTRIENKMAMLLGCRGKVKIMGKRECTVLSGIGKLAKGQRNGDNCFIIGKTALADFLRLK